MTLYILAISIALQTYAAVRALQMIRLTGHRMSWGLIALAVLLMAVRRSITFVSCVFGNGVIHPNPVAEIVALSISVFMTIGIFRIRSVFLGIRDAKETAESANIAKTEFLANMSHEIRTPMTAILGFAENLREHELPESQRLKYAQTIHRNGEALLLIINDILDLSKIEAGKLTTERCECHPCSIISEVAALMRVRSDEKGLPLYTDFIGAVPETIQSDPTRLRQILINLIGNAIKFTETGEVRVVTSLVDDGNVPRLQFDVIDTGLGLTHEQVGRLFQPFVQADSSTARSYGGTGLGLTISKRFAELLGGDIAVVKTEFAVGSTIRATVATGSLDVVNMLDDPSSAIGVAEDTKSLPRVAYSDLSGCRILLAEDNAVNQALIVGILKKAGAEITAVKDGKLALDSALTARENRSPFDVILMDIQMPLMSGDEAARLLRSKAYTGTVVALTAHTMAGDREKFLQMGFDDYATKPINRAILINTIFRHWTDAKSAPTSAK